MSMPRSLRLFSSCALAAVALSVAGVSLGGCGDEADLADEVTGAAAIDDVDPAVSPLARKRKPAPTSTTTSTAPAPAPTTTATTPATTPAWKPAELTDPEVQAAVIAASRKYKLPRWFYYAILHRESTFERCKVQDEGPAGPSSEDGRGLAQLSFAWYNGYPYPHGNATPNNTDPQWRANMGLDTTFPGWIDMANVTPLAAPRFATQLACVDGKPLAAANDAFDPRANLERFSSGFAAPQYLLRRRLSPTDSPEVTLRKVAYHWHYGLWGSRSGNYPIDPRPYLPQYDTYVASYKPRVDAEDGVYTGHACSPPYSATGC